MVLDSTLKILCALTFPWAFFSQFWCNPTRHFSIFFRRNQRVKVDCLEPNVIEVIAIFLNWNWFDWCDCGLPRSDVLQSVYRRCFYILGHLAPTTAAGLAATSARRAVGLSHHCRSGTNNNNNYWITTCTVSTNDLNQAKQQTWSWIID